MSSGPISETTSLFDLDAEQVEVIRVASDETNTDGLSIHYESGVRLTKAKSGRLRERRCRYDVRMLEDLSFERLIARVQVRPIVRVAITVPPKDRHRDDQIPIESHVPVHQKSGLSMHHHRGQDQQDTRDELAGHERSAEPARTGTASPRIQERIAAA